MKFTQEEKTALKNTLKEVNKSHTELFNLLQTRKDAPFTTDEEIELRVIFQLLGTISTMIYDSIYN